MSLPVPNGVGLGLRFKHFDYILSHRPQTPWFEIIADDFLSPGPHHERLHLLREQYPIVFHSVGLNIGGTDSFDKKYLQEFQRLYDVFEPAWISDHLCWSAHGGKFHHDLLPIPRTSDALDVVSGRIQYLQDYFQRPLCLENITSYIEFKDQQFSELEFIRQIVERTGCTLLLDITNVLINHKNRQQDPVPFFKEFPIEHVTQFHLSGGTWDEGVLIDSHGTSVEPDDIRVLRQFWSNSWEAPVIIERDSDVPEFEELEKERLQVESRLNDV